MMYTYHMTTQTLTDFQKLLEKQRRKHQYEYDGNKQYCDETGLMENVQAFDVQILEQMCDQEAILKIISSAFEQIEVYKESRTIIVTTGEDAE